MELAQSDSSILKDFYLTGGTALAAFYYHHRLSEDIDLFCEKKEVDHKATDAFLKKICPVLKVPHVKRSQFLGLVSYVLIFENGNELKVDFNYYPFPRIEKGTKFKNLEIDSIRDIAANKIHTIFMKPRTRDYIDIYFILRKEKYKLEDLILDAKIKFDWHIDSVNLASQFMRVGEFIKLTENFPKMLVSFDKNKMEKFFLSLAKSLEGEIFKQ